MADDNTTQTVDPETGVRDPHGVPENTAAPQTAASPEADRERVEFGDEAVEKATDLPVPVVTGGDSLVTEDDTPLAGSVEIVREEQEALVTEERAGDSDTVNVHEVSVVTDQRVRHVIVPPEGRGSLDLPIHQLAGERVEDVFAREASEPDDE